MDTLCVGALDILDAFPLQDVARNPISALSQSTRWMFGEVKNACGLLGNSVCCFFMDVICSSRYV